MYFTFGLDDIIQINLTISCLNHCNLYVEREKSLKDRSSALNPRTALTNILMLKRILSVFRITCIMLILEILTSSYKYFHKNK